MDNRRPKGASLWGNGLKVALQDSLWSCLNLAHTLFGICRCLGAGDWEGVDRLLRDSSISRWRWPAKFKTPVKRWLLKRSSIKRSHEGVETIERLGVDAAGYEFATLSFDNANDPIVSIIVSAGADLTVTAACLRSIQSSQCSVAHEVMVLVDASTQDDINLLQTLPGVQCVINLYGTAVLDAWNEAAEQAHGEYLCFLSSNSRVTQGWLAAMLDVFDKFSNCGLVGAKLVSTDGRLQEAGGIVGQDGSAMRYGCGSDPQGSQFNFVREVDFCSDACILIKRSVLQGLRGRAWCDSSCAPAYDLGFRLQCKNLKVYYTPFSLIVHLGGAQHDGREGARRENGDASQPCKCLTQWSSYIASSQLNKVGGGIARTNKRRHDRPIVLVVDNHVPQPDRDAGSNTISEFVRTFCELGCVVKFWPDTLRHDPVYTPKLQARGVEVFYGHQWSDGFERLLGEYAGLVDFVLLSRPLIADKYVECVRRYAPDATIIYYGHDIHFARLQQQYDKTGRGAVLREANYYRSIEYRLWQSFDVILYPSEDEVAHVRRVANNSIAQVVQPYCFDPVESSHPKAHTRSGLLFVGNFAHAPNVDAAFWFVEHVLPIIHTRHPEVQLRLVGSNPTARVKMLASTRVAVTGFVADDVLANHYASARVAVVPLRFGAGVKLKVLEALQHRVPLVTTSVGAQGLPNLGSVARITEEPAEFATAVCALLENDVEWARLSGHGSEYVQQHFSRASMRQSMARLLEMEF